jgi:hypothetical protein
MTDQVGPSGTASAPGSGGTNLGRDTGYRKTFSSFPQLLQKFRKFQIGLRGSCSWLVGPVKGKIKLSLCFTLRHGDVWGMVV